MGSNREQWKRFGDEIALLRRREGVSQEELAKLTGWSRAQISALQRGTRTPQRTQVESLDTALNAGGALLRLWKELVDTGREMPSWFRQVAILERSASEIIEYQPLVIPGMVQTPEYATAVVAGSALSPMTDVDAVVRSRLERRSRLRADVLLHFVITEGVLEAVKGSRAVMAEQLRVLAESTARINVLPTEPSVDSPVHPPFRVMSFHDRPKVGYVEHALGGEIIDDGGMVRKLEIMITSLIADSLPTSASAALLRKVSSEHEQYT